MTRRVYNIRSMKLGADGTSAQLPSADNLEYGELAINYLEGYETFSIKNSGGEVVPLRFGNVVNAFSEYTYNNGVSKVTTLASIPVTYKLAICTLSSASTFSLASTLGAGKELHVIVINSSSSDITVTLPNSGQYVTMDGETTMVVSGKGYADINVISDGTTMYIRELA